MVVGEPDYLIPCNHPLTPYVVHFLLFSHDSQLIIHHSSQPVGHVLGSDTGMSTQVFHNYLVLPVSQILLVLALDWWQQQNSGRICYDECHMFHSKDSSVLYSAPAIRAL